MFPTFRLDAPLPLASRDRTPLFSEAQVDAFVDHFEAPPSLRDPFTQALLRRPVAIEEATGDVLEVCVDESSLRHVMLEGHRPHPNQALAAPAHGARVLRHRPMGRQLVSFFDAANTRAETRYGRQSERFQAIQRYVDAALYEMRQPLMPVLAPSEQRLMADEALVPLRRAGFVLEQLRVGIEMLLPRAAGRQGRLPLLEQRRRTLLIDLSELRHHMRDARRLLWRVMTPPTRMPPAFFREWRLVYDGLHSAASTYEEVLWVEIPASLAIRAHEQRVMAERFLRGGETPSSP